MDLKKIPHDPKEIIAVVDSKDRVIGRHARKNHAGGRLHREASVLILNLKGEILLQTRRDNGRLDYSASGHFPYNHTYLQGAVRETKEELGLSLAKTKFREIMKKRMSHTYRGVKNDRFITLYETKGNYTLKDFKIDREEVEAIRFYSVDKIRNILNRLREKGGFKQMMELYLDRR
ncbi:MAG: NUDIX domain-containing protein [Candidatus Micrarchaeota archaeon]|nr:NUDIX domain-containing protein [Candidatus Micrarchaeota archaeon]